MGGEIDKELFMYYKKHFIANVYSRFNTWKSKAFIREFGIRLSDCKPRRSLPASPRREDTEEQSGRTLGGRMRRNGHLVG